MWFVAAVATMESTLEALAGALQGRTDLFILWATGACLILAAVAMLESIKYKRGR